MHTMTRATRNGEHDRTGCAAQRIRLMRQNQTTVPDTFSNIQQQGNEVRQQELRQQPQGNGSTGPGGRPKQ
jgi:hypothetical protein